MADMTIKDASRAWLPVLGFLAMGWGMMVGFGMCPAPGNVQSASGATVSHEKARRWADKEHTKILKRIDQNQRDIIDMLK